MNFLLDTHIFIWWHSEPDRLSARVNLILHDPQHSLFLSLTSVWEMQIKTQIGKLQFKTSLLEVLQQQQQVNQLHYLPITLEHVLALDKLPLHHKDPFDRLLIAQALTENITLLTNDPLVTQYPVTTLW